MRRGRRRLAESGVLLLSLVLAVTCVATGQTATPAHTLDLNRYMGVWYEIARYPVKAEKRCVSDGRVLYALGDKANSFQMGTFCEQKNGSPGEWDYTGRRDKSEDGKLKLSHLVLFHTKYWVLATGPDYGWALVGTPNHKSLWVLSRTAALAPAVRAEIDRTASAAGFKTGKLIEVPQHPVLSTTAAAQPTAQPAPPSP